MSKKILIVTNSHDLHADLVTARLIARDAFPFRLNLDAFPRDYQTCQWFADGKLHNKIRRIDDAAWLDLNQVGAVWIRKDGEYSFVSDDLSAQELAFARLETEHALFSLLYTLDCFWMSHPVALRGAQWKGEQLQRAARLGFRVPDSLITNAPDEVRRFRRDTAGEMVFKAMSSPMLAAEQVAAEQRIAGGLRTAIVDQDMMDSVDAVRQMACHFQQYIPKQHELRVTVIGERVFAARIHSQDDERTAIDSRDMSAPIRYEAATLSAELAQRCLAFVRSYDLAYGALDLIVTPAGDVVFLENNPAGQFLYIEQLIPEFKMIDAVADVLMEGARCR
jgi:glutathione synthase/RimK-type ligase-like ATP-grasp enzyme